MDENGKLNEINEQDAVKLSEEELEKVMYDFNYSLQNTPFGLFNLFGEDQSMLFTDDFDNNF